MCKVIHVLKSNWTWVALMCVPIVRFVIFDDMKKIEVENVKHENLKGDMNWGRENDNFNWKIVIFSSELLDKIIPKCLVFYKNQIMEIEEKNEQLQPRYYNQYNQKIISLDYWNLLFLIVHGDIHSGNILLDYADSYISDFGLSRPVKKIVNSNEIYGVIPYMAPEVLRGKPYTKAADIYSLELLYICKGLIPEIVKGTLPVYARLMTRCWDSDPDKRPTADELYQFFSFWYRQLLRVIESLLLVSNEPITKNHPLSCDTSRKIDYSAKLNEILNQEELSIKFIIDEEREFLKK
ncbi:kinase-like protein [Rhizophagus irregularis]|uniref:Kinase-like protein n=1 Tax=Rhizophagus irregularis TaxID=588596 RepID=A0A2N0Q3P7_9GLOM|nr:kinase-like protein [Rhizophagus irregularis]